MPRFITQIVETYRLAFVFMLAAFPLACLPILFEGLQHIAEVKLGMFINPEVRNFTNADQNKRLVFGVFKVLSLLAVAILLPRYFIHERDLKRTVKFSLKALKSIFIAFIISALAVLWIFVLGPMGVSLIIKDASNQMRMIAPMLFIIVAAFPLQSLMNKGMAKVLDDMPLSETENQAMTKAMMGGFAPLMILAIAPWMVLHYMLNIKAMGQSLPTLWAILTLDSVVVGVLGALMAAAIYMIYRDARSG